MDLFHVIPDGFAILRRKGVYEQAPLYRRGTAVYAKQGRGFVRLLSHHNTTHPDVRWEEFAAEGVALGNGPLEGPRFS